MAGAGSAERLMASVVHGVYVAPCRKSLQQIDCLPATTPKGSLPGSHRALRRLRLIYWVYWAAGLPACARLMRGCRLK
jgi:hypothetical protein